MTNNETYIASCLEICKTRLVNFSNVADVKEALVDLNAYENLDSLTAPKDVQILDELSENEINQAKQCILDGRFFAEHAAAGEATRLGLGTKYLINIKERLSEVKIAKLISIGKGEEITKEQVIKEAGCKPEELLSMDLGTRHMLAYSFAIYNLAVESSLNPKEVLSRQKMLIILNSKTAEQIISSFENYNFFGFLRENVYFMVQRRYHGINLLDGNLGYDIKSPKRLHNHGQMVMQETMDDEIFFVSEDGSKIFLKSAEFEDVLEKMDDKQSFNIEDLAFLINAIDYKSLAFALEGGKKGYRMVMEIVANNPKAPQKGGMAAFDKKIGRNVMIESFQLKGVKNEDIKYLNKNFNHYPRPSESYRQLKKKGLNMPFAIKKNHIYFEPVQGDINFLVKTEFVKRKVLKPIISWKSSATTPLAIKYMKKQDDIPGFVEYISKFSQSR